ncbi:MAG: RNA methyltransferase [Candidatus Zambryskibacteria bacterium CG10_big_fil_rev_8_21_14_0_10_42_12]|uniref:RNA methyltransferase n=1 Tax=Candidatus Zambryskibacteria bacterium CG10_big_fil_rev_8_21_14_0_10_42_12 TaxID=1975115 RepID=A0A2H0QUL7_9BACT|nr:MAG: RNA methyltransferase [Candidatus Zambryskibacteria bacterium CG10_big_fil_rev_8_21_14_0_10_42_12]
MQSKRKTEQILDNVYLVLDNIRSIHNVGSIFRTAACAGVKEILLCGYTPEPTDRFGRIRKDFEKVSLGGEKEVLYTKVKTTEEALDKLHEKGVTVVAIEQSPRATPFKNFKPTYPIAYVLGNEVDGIAQEILERSDETLEIPLRGHIKESLNVSVVAGIVLFT